MMVRRPIAASGAAAASAPDLANAEQGVKNAEKLIAVKGVQVYYHDPCLAGPERLSGRRHPRARQEARRRKLGDPNHSTLSWRATLRTGADAVNNCAIARFGAS